MESDGNDQRMSILREVRQVYMGATLFYGYLDIDLLLSGPDAATHSRRLRLHNYSGGYNAGIGRRDGAESAAAHLLVEAAQEINSGPAES